MMVCGQGVYVLFSHVMCFVASGHRASPAANRARDNSRGQRIDDSAPSEFQIAARTRWGPANGRALVCSTAHDKGAAHGMVVVT